MPLRTNGLQVPYRSDTVCPADISAIDRAVLVFVHDEEPCVRQRGDQSPEVRVTGHEDEAVDALCKVALTDTGSHDDINKALSFCNPVYQDMFDRYLCELIEPLPAYGRVVVIV